MVINWKELIKAAPKGSSAGKTNAQKLAATMDKALAAYKAGNKNVKRPTVKAVGDQVEFSVRYANQAIELARGISIAQVPAIQFEDVFAGIKASVLAGEFDAQLTPLADKAKARGAKLSTKLATTPRKPRTPKAK